MFDSSPVATQVAGRLTLGGEQIYSGTVALSDTVLWNELAIIVVDDAGDVCVEDLTDGLATDDCPT
jgi:hypothetical protein